MIWLPLIALLASSSPATLAPASDPTPLLVVMAPTGETRNGLPVYTRHPDGSGHEAVLTRGFSGRWLRLFRWQQQFLSRRDGTPLEPAYLLLSNNQGGFPRFGFWLDGERKDEVGYVDLHRQSDLTGRFGAMDQIFPHELAHVIVRQLAGPPPAGSRGANQVHALGVRTDRVTAFDEGFAEHVQVLAVDDEDAAPETAVLAGRSEPLALADHRLRRYRHALEARWSLAPPERMGFVLWFSQTEQILRYHAVKANAFARDRSIPAALLARADPYPAYLFENVLPGAPDAAFKSTPRLLATESVIAALFVRWAGSPALQRPADPTLYERFGIDPHEDVMPTEHVYLKLFAVLADRQPHDAVALIRGYVDAFPAEADAVAGVVGDVGLEWPLPDVPEIWLANEAFTTGTTLFDQYRALPRVHTFDLNAASIVDLAGVEGMSIRLAGDIMREGPYAAVGELTRVPGMTPPIANRFRVMEQAMAGVRAASARSDIESIDLVRLFRPVFVRAALWIVLAAAAAGWLYGLARRIVIWRLVVNGLAASAVALLAAWVLGPALKVGDSAVDPLALVFLPLAAFGLPGALWQMTARRSLSSAGRVAAAWALACLPPALVVTPLF